MLHENMDEGLVMRMTKLRLKLDDIQIKAAARIKARRLNEKLREQMDGYEPSFALEALQLLASSVIVEEISENNLRLALREIANRFEALDDWMTGGGEPPEQWTVTP